MTSREKIYVHYWTGNEAHYINRPEGFVKVNMFPDGTAEIYDLIVYPEHRGKGFGKLLMLTAIEQARICGCTRIVLFPDTASWTEDWYMRLGFFTCDKIKSSMNGKPSMIKYL